MARTWQSAPPSSLLGGAESELSDANRGILQSSLFRLDASLISSARCYSVWHSGLEKLARAHKSASPVATLLRPATTRPAEGQAAAQSQPRFLLRSSERPLSTDKRSALFILSRRPDSNRPVDPSVLGLVQFGPVHPPGLAMSLASRLGAASDVKKLSI